jgi:O-antigen/teichoic acid export membrane protein
VSPFRNILRLFVGDVAAKSILFVTLIYLARTLGPEPYGVLEFATAVTSYLLVVADCGLEMWATREVSRDTDLRRLAGRVLGLRLVLAAPAIAGFVLLLQVFPDYPSLRMLLLVGAALPVANALSLRWALLGRERMGAVATSTVAGQIVTSAIIISFVHDESALAWVLVARVVGAFVVSGVFARQFVLEAGGWPHFPTLAGWRTALAPAAVMCAIQILGVLSYNFDSIILGALAGPVALGLYGAAYKIVTVAVTATMTYYLGLFPTLARTWVEEREVFHTIARRSFRLAVLSAIPIGVAGSMLAGPAIDFLYGPLYASAAPALRVLCWSAALVNLRGTFRNALTATGFQGLDFRCAAVATAVNVGMNLLLIPPFGMLGAASATVSADVVWFALALFCYRRRCGGVSLVEALWRPVVASAFMAAALQGCLYVPVDVLPIPKTVQSLCVLLICGAVGLLAYAATLAVLGEPELLALRRRSLDTR